MKDAPISRKLLDLTEGNRIAGCMLTIGGNWAIQGIWYMDNTEKVVHIIVEAILGVIIATLLMLLLAWNWIPALVIAIVIAHTANWSMNGHFWALMLDSGLTRFGTGTESLMRYGWEMKNRLEGTEHFMAMYGYGSISRGTASDTSDLDIRLVLHPNRLGAAVGCLVASRERLRAFVYRFPLDLHTLDTFEGLAKMRSDENPVVFFENASMKPDSANCKEKPAAPDSVEPE